MHDTTKHFTTVYCLAIYLVIGWTGSGAAGVEKAQVDSDHTHWVEQMKSAERGPFSRIRWFCKDGQILPPKAYACADFGGGVQHGEWSERTKTLRAAGYAIANFYSDLDVDEFVGKHANSAQFQQMLIEQFLIRIDNGWILRRAHAYRGALQAEDERSGARKLLLQLAGRHDWVTYRYLVLRTAARLLAHGTETASVQEIRQLSASLSDRDPGFKPLRNKIHGNPELKDAAAVRSYSVGQSEPGLSTDLERLAGLIEAVFTADISERLRSLAKVAGGAADIAILANAAGQALAGSAEPRENFRDTARLLADLRDHITVAKQSRLRLAMLDTSLVVESELFTVASELEAAVKKLPRADQLEIIGDNLLALYGVGLLTKRQLDAAQGELQALLATSTPSVGRYKRVLDYLALAPSWSTQALRRFFAEGMDKLHEIEPIAGLYIQDHLRGSPMFIYAARIDALVRDANALAGVSNELFGNNVGFGLRSLNPGLARGPLRLALGKDIADLDTDGIYLLPETVSELPPVAGILTEGEGNPLSHVQLLARNLGIPNVGVDQSQLETLRQHEGTTVVLAVSPAGSVRLNVDDGSFGAAFDENNKPDEQATLIKVDLEKLDLNQHQFMTLSELRASDSGRVVGPKAAKLGELKHHYPKAVAEGLAIPFGSFKDILEQPMAGTAGSVFEWMQGEYARLGELPRGSSEHRAATEIFRTKLQDTIKNADPGDEFRERLRTKLIEVFGADGSFGVFVRSDTNVEDLPGFTGAGLNLTVANVVGIDNILAAVSRVWASPFSARSFAWRQTLMDKPEHVYPAVLLMLSVDADKSGVLVTQDIDSGDKNWLSVAVNEGVGGAVDGQSAESIRINTVTGDVRLMAEATASIRRKVDLSGGVKKLPVSSADRVLVDGEIAQLIEFAKQLPDRFPAVIDASGKAAPADIEFGFLDGELRLFQIRPFLDSDRARGNDLLRQLDAPLANRASNTVSLEEIP